MSSTGIYRFENFSVDVRQRTLRRENTALPITPKAFDMLVLLVQNPGQLLDKEYLIQAIWPDIAVEENNLNQTVSTLRRVLGETPGQPRYIATQSGRGYRFLAKTTCGDAPQATPRARIVVLPFENLSSDQTLLYLADGLTEETIAALGQIEPAHIAVIGRTTAMTYRHTTKTLSQIGREVNASHLVESSLRSEGGRFRITSKLINAADELQVWSASFDSEPSSVLQFQQELATAIAEQIRLRLAPQRLDALGRRQTANPEAYNLYLQGRHLWNQLTAETTRKAVACFQQATTLDPHYALAWSGIADALSSSPIHGDAAPLQVAARARDAAERALASEPELAEVQTALGAVRFWLDWDWKGAEEAYRTALKLDPNYALGHRMLGVVLFHSERHEEAEAAITRARELDPLYEMHQALSSQIAFHSRRFKDAVHYARQAIVINPHFWIARLFHAQALVELGDLDAALDALAIATRLGSPNSKLLAMRGYVLARQGQSAEAKEIAGALAAFAADHFVPPAVIALVHLGLGDVDRALQLLEEGLKVRDVHLEFLPVDPKWDSVRSHERFRRLLTLCNFTR